MGPTAGLYVLKNRTALVHVGFENWNVQPVAGLPGFESHLDHIRSTTVLQTKTNILPVSGI